MAVSVPSRLTWIFAIAKEYGIEPHARSSSSEIVSLTSLRGFLAVWVVLGHFWQEILTLLPGLGFLSPWAEHGHSAVPGFFVLSGWVLAHNYKESFRKDQMPWLRFLAMRLARIYPVHLAMLAVLGAMVAATALLGRPVSGAYGLGPLISQLLLVQAWIPGMAMTWNYPAWSISSEWFAYLFFPLAARADFLLVSPARAITTTIVAVCLTVAVVLYWNPLPFFQLALVVPCFLAGMGIQALCEGKRFGRSSGVVATVLLGSLVASCFVPSFAIREFLLASIPAGLIYLLAGRGNAFSSHVWESRPVRVVGETSYSLYMVHSVVEKVLNQVVAPERFSQADLVPRLAVLSLWLALTVFATWGCYRFVERPARRFMKRMLA